MKTTILGIAAAAAITFATAGAASAAPSSHNAGLFEGGSAAQMQLARVGGRRFGLDWGYGGRHNQRCRRLYYRGYVQGDRSARRMYNRLCTPHHFGHRN